MSTPKITTDPKAPRWTAFLQKAYALTEPFDGITVRQDRRGRRITVSFHRSVFGPISDRSSVGFKAIFSDMDACLLDAVNLRTAYPADLIILGQLYQEWIDAMKFDIKDSRKSFAQSWGHKHPAAVG